MVYPPSAMYPQQQSAMPAAVGIGIPQQLPHQQHLPILDHIDTLLQTLNDTAQRDDLKYKALQEISDSFEELTATPAVYASLVESLLRAFLKLLAETAPQFIAENNTQVGNFSGDV